MPFRPTLLVAAAVYLAASPLSAQTAQYYDGVEWETPPKVDPGRTNSDAPSDAVVLFDGTDMSAFDGGENWILKDGYVVAAKRSVATKQKFGSVQLHLEYAAPPEDKGEGQGRGNSGIYFMGGRYEVQVLDMYDNETYPYGQGGSVYKQIPPMVNPFRPPGAWNEYDVIFRAPKFDLQGTLLEPARVTVMINGVCVVEQYALKGKTTFANAVPHYVAHPDKLPLVLQYHNDPVRFRNIWIRELEPPKG
ncbi:MAG: DUF1080 domain-containing protein, partial [Planctomycetota bacterium]